MATETVRSETVKSHEQSHSDNHTNRYTTSEHSTGGAATSELSTNKVLKNTYALLAMTLFFSALTAGISLAFNLPHPGLLITLVGYFGLLFLTTKFRDSAIGLLCVFALTGFMGYTLGPMINAYLKLANGGHIVLMALGGTALVFSGLSAFVLVTKKNFSFIGNFLFVGILVGFIAGLAAVFLNLPGLALAVSSIFILLMAGLILFETSNIIHGGETNYIMATVTLYVAIYNLFTSLMHVLGISSGE